MDSIKYAGILIIILGLIFMCFPIFSSVLLTVVVGFGLILLGFATVITGVDIWEDSGALGALTILLGLIGAIIGLLFICFFDAVSILVSLEFYIIGIIMLVMGICGVIIKEDSKAKLMSALIIILGIVSFLIAVFALAEPIYTAILIGLVLVIDGVLLLIND